MSGTYWFDEAPLVAELQKPERPAFDNVREGLGKGGSVKSRLAALRKVELSGLVKDTFASGPRPIELFAEANGLDYRSWLRPTAFPHRSDDPAGFRPGLLFRKRGGSQCNHIVSWAGPPYVEFGNMSASSVDAADSAGWGWIGIRHGLQLPHIVLDARANDATTPRRSGRIVTSLTEHSKGTKTFIESASAPLRPIPVSEESDAAYQAWVGTAGDDEAVRLLSGAFRSAALATTAALDVEIVEGWVFLYGYSMAFSTTDPDRWAWLFSLASRWLEALHALGGDDGRVAPLYTPGLSERPETATIVRPDAGYNALTNESYWWGT